MPHPTESDRLKHALAEQLAYLPRGEVYWRGPDGEPITGPDLLAMLEARDPLVDAYLEDVVATAISLVRVRVKKAPAVADRIVEPDVAAAGALACGWCSQRFPVAEAKQLDAHLRTCAQSPFVRRLTAFRLLAEDLAREIAGERAWVSPELRRRIEDLLDEEHLV